MTDTDKTGTGKTGTGNPGTGNPEEGGLIFLTPEGADDASFCTDGVCAPLDPRAGPALATGGPGRLSAAGAADRT